MKKKRAKNITIRKQIKHPMESKEIIDNAVFYPSTRGAKVPKRKIYITYNENTFIKVVSDLNQSHRNILDTIMALAYRDNTIASSSNGYKVEAYYACKWSDLYKIYGRHTNWLLEHIEDIVRTLVALHTEKNGIKKTRTTGLIPEYGFISTQENYFEPIQEKLKEIAKTNIEKQTRKTNPNWFKPKEGDIFWIAISFNWLVPMDLTKVRVNFSLELLGKLRKESGLIMAVIIFIISQKVGFHIHAENLLEKVKPDWGELSRRTKWQLFLELSKNVDTFKEYNINYNSEEQLFCYNIACKGVGFSEPIPENKERTIKAIGQLREGKNSKPQSLEED